LVTNDADAVKRVYTIKVNRLINGISASNILIAKSSTTSKITAETSTQLGMLSSKPLSGSYKVKCIDSEGFESISRDIPYDYNAIYAQKVIMESCDRLYDKIELLETNIGYRENMIRWNVRFVGLNENPGQFEIISDDTKPLTGDNITFYANTTVPYSTNLFYEPIPFEFLKTYETKP
jgi:hypothetical protein